MKDEKIPDQDHIARLCNPSHIQEGQIQASAFMLKEDRDEKTLSVNWLEFLKCPNRESEITGIRTIYSLKFNRVGAKAKIAILNIGEVCNIVLTESNDGRILEVLHAPELDDPTHSEIYNLRVHDDFIAELILETISESYLARL